MNVGLAELQAALDTLWGLSVQSSRVMPYYVSYLSARATRRTGTDADQSDSHRRYARELLDEVRRLLGNDTIELVVRWFDPDVRLHNPLTVVPGQP